MISRVCAVLLFVGWIGVWGCASAPSEPTAQSSGNYFAKEILESSLRFRRPPGAGADPRVSPGGADYFGAKTAGATFDCEMPAMVFKRARVSPAAVLQCVSSLSSPITVTFRLIRDVEPYWELDREDDTPACLVTTLARIPVPREIIYQARVREENSPLEPVDCLASRLNIEKGKVLEIGVPLVAKTHLELAFPPKKPWTSEAMALQQLTSWSMAPFIADERVSGKLFPSPLCRACAGKETLVLEKDYITQPKWGFRIENSKREE